MNADFSFVFGGNEFFSRNAGFHPCEGGRYCEPGNGVKVTQRVTEYGDLDAVWWTLYFENTEDKNSPVISDINDCDCAVRLPPDPPLKPGFLPDAQRARVVSFGGMVEGRLYSENDRKSAAEFAPRVEYLNRKRHYENAGGRSSDTLLPFFVLEASGEKIFVAVGWTGDWRTDFEKTDGGVRIRAGLKRTGFYLLPGEMLRTSSVLIMRSAAGEDGFNKFRRLIRRHFSPDVCSGSGTGSLLAFELWGGLPSEEMKRRIASLKDAGVGFEQIWLDAGWYGNCADCRDPFSGDWSRFTGDWRVNGRVHPGGLEDVAEEIRGSGMEMMLWIEPERSVRDLPAPVSRPEWFLFCKNAEGKPSANAILNLGDKEAAEYAFDTVASAIRRYSLGCFRQDFNVSLTPYFAQNDPPDRIGVTEIKHVTGLYAFWDRLLAEFPGLVIDNCASGGRRIDIETLRRSLIFFRSDYQCGFNADPEVLQVHNSGASLILPLTGCTTKVKNDVYNARSSFSSSWGGAFWNAVFQDMNGEDLAWAKKTVEEYKSVRRFFSRDFYDHGSRILDRSAWAIWQYHDPESGEGIVLAFRRSDSPNPAARISLKGIGEGARLELRDADSGAAWNGGADLTLEIPDKRQSRLIYYKTV